MSATTPVHQRVPAESRFEHLAEIDDGLAAEALPNGGVRLWIHIADPSRWVLPGSPLAVEAARRASTLYLPTGEPDPPAVLSLCEANQLLA